MDFRYDDASEQKAFTDLEKAVTADTITGAQTWGLGTTGSSLKYESLKNTIVNLSIQLDMIKLYRDMPKKKIYNTVHEFAQQTKNNTTRSAGLLEGEVPYINNSEYVRRAVTTAYVGELRQVTDIALQTAMLQGTGDAILAQEVENGVVTLHERLNQLVARGNKDVVPTEFNGINALHSDLAYWASMNAYYDSSFVIDKRNAYMSEPDINDAMRALVQDGKGNPRNVRLYTTPSVLTNYTNNLANTKFVNIGVSGSQTADTGQQVSGFLSTMGRVPFHWDIALDKQPARYTTDLATSDKAPLAPTTPTIATVADTQTRFAGFNGTYFYAVSATNRFGESILLPITPAVQAVLATEAVNLGWADGGGTGLQATTGFVIYRSEVNPTGALADTPLYPIFEVSLAQKSAGYDGAVAGLVRDRNRQIPNTEEAWLIQWDTQTIEMAELFGMRKIELPYGYGNFMGRSIALLNYGMPLLYAPKRVIRITNIRK
jgi:hypothetical protein